MDSSAADRGSTPTAGALPLLHEGSVEPFEIIRLIGIQSAIAALISLVGSTLLSVVLERAGGLDGQSGGVASEAYSDLGLALTVPTHVILPSASSSGGQRLLDVSISWPVSVLTLVILFACGMAGWRAAKLTRAGPLVGLGVAIVFATLVSILVYVVGAYSQIESVIAGPWLTGGTVSPILQVDAGESWQHGFAWALVPALLGAGAGRPLQNLVRGQMREDLYQQWRAAAVGAAWAVAAALALCGTAAFLMLELWARSVPVISGHSPAIQSVVLTFAPSWGIWAMVVGVGGSLQASARLGSAGSVSPLSLSLMGHWPLTSWAYVLPLLAFAGFLVGSRQALALDRNRLVGFRMVIPFALCNACVAELAALGARVRMSQELVNSLSQSLGASGLDSQNQVLSAASTGGVGVSFGSSLLGVLIGSVVVGSLAAVLVYYWLEPDTGIGQAPILEPAGGPGSSPPLEPGDPLLGDQDWPAGSGTLA